MKWYDYFFCLLYADIISASVVHFNFIGLISGIGLYIVYELTRKELNNASRLR